MVYILTAAIQAGKVNLVNETERTKNVACDILAPSAVAFMQHLPIARVRILSGAFFIS